MNADMIQTILSGMIKLMLAKFIMNDMPHAAGLLPNSSYGRLQSPVQAAEEGQPFSADTAWDIDELTMKTEDRPATKVEDGVRIDEALEAWKTSEKWEDLRKLVGFTKGSADYRSKLIKILRSQYGGKITVWRGGEPGIGLASVTSSRDAAAKFQEWRGGVLEQFTVDTNKVLAAITTVESELIVNVADLMVNPTPPDPNSWDNVWKSCVQAAKILRKELTEQDIPANWPELRRLHKDLWAQVYAKRKPAKKSNPGSSTFRVERTTVGKILDDLEHTWHRIESDKSIKMQKALSILKDIMGYYPDDACVVVWNNGDLAGVAAYTTFRHTDLGLRFTHISELASFMYEPGIGSLLVKEVIKIAREHGSDVVSLYYGPGAKKFYEGLGFGRTYMTSYEPTALTYLIKD